MEKDYTRIDKCPITHDKKKVKYFDLGNIPLVNNLCNTQEEAINCKKYPLSINFFPNSGESALEYAVDGEILFSSYLFKSGVNIPYYKHCQDMFLYLDNKFEIEEGSVIMDIGGNDGSLLDAFRSVTNKHLSYLNIDPSNNLTDISREKGINTITNFFTYELAQKINFKADIITSTNVFQHLKDINGFAAGVELLLNEQGIWVLEFPYWINSMETNQFDQIYHEHMYYHSVTPLFQLMKNNGLEILDVIPKEIHGGTLRLIIGKRGNYHNKSIVVSGYLKEEKKYNLSYHIRWGNKIHKYIHKCKHSLEILVNQGKTIYGFGAAAKGCIFLNAMKLDYNSIPFIIDDTDIKQNKFIPGVGSKVIIRDILLINPPDYILILAHNFKDYIMTSLRDYGYTGKFIILVPEFEIYE